jgi:hypothetical protein
VAQWTNFELSELAVVDHVRTVDHFSGDAAEAATGKSRLGVDLQAAVTAAGDSCPETAAKALNAAPKWFVTQQSVLYDASLVFINNVKGAIKLNAASLAYYFKSNTANYRTICATYVAIQDVQSTITTFLAGVKKNKPATQLAKQFNGSTNLYCYKPGYTGYVAIREYTEGQTLDRFPQEPQTEQDQDGTYYFYFVAPTSYSENTYATAAPAVLADARNYNDSLAAVAEKHLLASSHIAVAFPFGTWDAKTQQVVGVTAPLPADVLNNGQGLIP